MLTHDPRYPANLWNLLTRAALALLGLAVFQTPSERGKRATRFAIYTNARRMLFRACGLALIAAAFTGLQWRNRNA